MFYIDGSMEVRVSASGYLQGGYWEPEQEGYGTRIQEFSSASYVFYTFALIRHIDLVFWLKWALYTTT